MKKRMLALLLALVMIVGLLPTVALAADGTDELKLSVDLTDYPVELQSYRITSLPNKENNHEMKVGEVNTYTYEPDAIIKTEWGWMGTAFSLKLNDAVQAKSWLVNGVEVAAPGYRYAYYNTETKTWSVEEKTISGQPFAFQFTLKNNELEISAHYTGVQVGMPSFAWTFKPVLAGSDFDYTATAAPDNEEHGTVSIGPDVKLKNVYNMTVTEKDGWTFTGWVNAAEPETVISTKYKYTTPALTQNESYLATFEEWKAPTVKVVPEGAANPVCTRTEGNKWEIRGGLTGDYAFDYWAEEAADGTETRLDNYYSATIRPSLTENKTYVLHCKPIKIDSIQNATAYAFLSYGSSVDEPAPLYAGTLVNVEVRYGTTYYGMASTSKRNHISLYAGDKDTVQAALASDTKPEPFASKAFGRSEAGNGQVTFSVRSWPNVNGKVTVELYTEDCEKFYTEFEVKTVEAAAGLDLSYLSMPDDVKTENSTSPAVRNVLAFHDETGKLALYAAGWGGVYEMNYAGATSMTRVAGQSDLYISSGAISHTSRVAAVGGKDLDDLTALYWLVEGENTRTELRRYDSDTGKMVAIPDSELENYTVGPWGTNTVLIMSGTDVWAGGNHWDGKTWTKTDVGSFGSFFKVDNETAYAMVTNNGTSGVYRYTTETGTWTEVTTLPETDPTLINVSASGKLITKYKDSDGNYAYDVVDSDCKTVLATYHKPSGSVLGGIWGASKQNPRDNNVSDWNAFEIGFGANEEIFAIIKGADASDQTRRYILKATDAGWTLMDTHGANGYDIEGTSEETARPTTVQAISNVAPGLTVFYGDNGTLYLQSAQHTVTFDAKGGTCDPASYTGQVSTAVPVPTATREGYTFAGWFLDEECTKPWTETVVPAADITVYAKWTQGSKDAYADDRAKALEQLDKALKRLNESDYSPENWNKIQQEYKNGQYQISVAQPNPKSDSQADINQAINDTIYAALNTAVNRMNDVPMKSVPNIQVVVSLDAQTLGLGYLIKPTLVTVPKKTLASKVITDQIVQLRADDENLRHTGLSDKGNDGESLKAPYFDYLMQGEVNNGFYLAQVYWPNQQDVSVADYIAKRVGNGLSIEKDSKGNYLGEFDYYSMSGWMYSVGQVAENDDGTADVVSAPSFPGVGASGWGMQDGEVMRWQFTVYGYGADLNADNSEWGSSSIAGNAGDKTLLTYEIAKLREKAKDAKGSYDAGDSWLETSKIYVNVYENTLCNPLATQDELDAAVEALKLIDSELAHADDLGDAELEFKQKLGTIETINDETKQQAAAAREYYDSLDDELKNLFDAAYPELVKQLTDAEAAIKAVDAINAIGEVTKDSGAAIKAARTAYDELNDDAKALVPAEALNTLTAAEEKYAELTKPVKPVTPVTPVTPSKPSTPKDDKPAGSSFSDVASGSWYEEAVKYVSEKGLMNGTGTGTFSPNATTTRGMIVTILARVEGVNTNGTPWYAAGQKWAMENGISDGTNMTGSITREQLAAILYRYAKQKGYDVSKSAALTAFSDADKVSSYAVEAMQWAVAEGLLQGSNGKLDPQGSATRAQVATILMRFMQNIAK